MALTKEQQARKLRKQFNEIMKKMHPRMNDFSLAIYGSQAEYYAKALLELGVDVGFPVRQS